MLTAMEDRPYDIGTVHLRLRAQNEADLPFLRALFHSHASAPLMLGGMPAHSIDTLVAMQFRSTGEGYRARYPDAQYWIIECAGEAIGRLIEHDEESEVYFPDFALLPEWRSKGIGTAFIVMVADEWARKGRAARVDVLMNNHASLKLCRKAGFTEIAALPNGYRVLRRETGVA